MRHTNRRCTFHAQCIIFEAACLWLWFSLPPSCLSLSWKTFVFIRCVFFPFSVYKLIDIFTTFCRVAVVVVGGFAGRAQSRSEPSLSSTIHYPLFPFTLSPLLVFYSQQQQQLILSCCTVHVHVLVLFGSRR